MQILDDENSQADEYRVGLTAHTRDGKKVFFRNLNEAVTEELTRMLLEQFIDSPLFAQEMKQTRWLAEKGRHARTAKGEKLFNSDTFYAEVEDAEDDRVRINTKEFTQIQERAILRKLIRKISERNSDKFENEQRVFELFASSMITGNLIQLGRLIDRTFSIGTFRRIGELDGQINKQELYIDSL
ncbi:MAG: hypothetical protein WC823_05805, partial [Parcubacteria group bacterium]|jgi:hypothetical protein